MIKKGILFVLFSIAFTFSYAQSGIEFFEGKWTEALETAKKEGKILFVDSYTTWCGPCKRMARDVFTQEKVGSFFNENFINLKLDMEQPDGRSFGSKYAVSAYPTMFFLGVDGEIVQKIKGARNADQLLDLGKKAMKSYDRSGDFEEEYNNGNRDFDLVYGYIKALNNADKSSLKVSNDYLKTNPDISGKQMDQFLLEAAVEADSKIFDKMVERKKSIIKNEGEDAYNKQVLSACEKTVDKAIEFEYKELVDEAIEKAKNLSSGAKKFEYRSLMKYSAAMGEDKEYVKAASDLLKKEAKKDPALVDFVIRDIHDNFVTSKDAVKLAAKYAKKEAKDGLIFNKMPLYCKMLVLNGERDEALKIVNKAIKEAKEEERPTMRLENLLNFINAQKELGA